MVNVETVSEELELEVISCAGALGRPVVGGYASDLLSCVMARAKQNFIWVTLQSHVNVVAVASLLGLAGVIITVPLILSNVLAFTFMVVNNPPLPLTTATLPVSSVGIGLGVDYGIYLVSRIIEEYKNSADLNQAISTALGTTGKAIVFIATTLMCGIVFWFLSKLMFQALMGLLLAIILLFNMLGALLIIPACIALVQPKFILQAK